MLIDRIQSKEFLDKGWSNDRKYRITDDRGQVFLLRISPADEAARRTKQQERIVRAAELGIPMCRPVEWGLCQEGFYTVHDWIDGTDAEEIIPGLPRQEQYRYGLEAGRILKLLHTLPAPEATEDWAERFNRKIDRKIAMYEACPLKYPGGEKFLQYLHKNRHLLNGRPQSYQHGDYHIGNMMIDRNGTLTIIDFEKDDFGDPWEEFNRIVWSAQAAPAFAAGMVDGYFDGAVPQDFWDLLALYICSNTLGSLPWAIPFGDAEVATMQNQAAQVLDWYDGLRTTIPSWYSK